jgi:hypothetical protein
MRRTAKPGYPPCIPVRRQLISLQETFALMRAADRLEPDLAESLTVLLVGVAQEQRWSVDDKNWWRWLVVGRALDQGLHWTDGEAFERAAADLRGTPARGAPGSMKLSYQRVQQQLRPEQRRKKRKPIKTAKG